jgi:hypothetical protein
LVTVGSANIAALLTLRQNIVRQKRALDSLRAFTDWRLLVGLILLARRWRARIAELRKRFVTPKYFKFQI